MANLVRLPDEIKATILEQLDAEGACNLSLVHSAWTAPARSIIFRHIETTKRTNENLQGLVQSMLPKCGSCIRRLGLNFSWHLNTGRISSAAQMEDWLRERDTHFSDILKSAPQLKILCIRFQLESRYIDPPVQAVLDQTTLTRTAEALCQRNSLQTLQLDFNMRGVSQSIHSAMLPTVAFVDVLAKSGVFRNLTTLSLANITVANVSTVDAAQGEMDAFHSFRGFICSLPALLHLHLDNFFCPPSALSQMLPQRVKSLELLDTFQYFDATKVFEALATKPNLQHFRFKAKQYNFPPIEHANMSNALEPKAMSARIVPLETLCLDCPELPSDQWLHNVTNFIKQGHLHFPNMHTLGLLVANSSVEDNFAAIQLGRAICDKACFPRLKVLQMPEDKVWGKVVGECHLFREMRKIVRESGSELQLLDDPAELHKRFESALQQCE